MARKVHAERADAWDCTVKRVKESAVAQTPVKANECQGTLAARRVPRMREIGVG